MAMEWMTTTWCSSSSVMLPRFFFHCHHWTPVVNWAELCRFVFLDPERVTCGPRLSFALIYRPADRMFPISLGRVWTKRCPDLQLFFFDRCLSGCCNTCCLWLKRQWRVMADTGVCFGVWCLSIQPYSSSSNLFLFGFLQSYWLF